MAIDCEKVRRLLDSYHDRQLRGRKFDEISEHLRQCENCSTELEKLECVSGVLQAHYKNIVADEDLSQIWAQVDSAVSVSSGPWPESVFDKLVRILWIPGPAWAAVGVAAIAIFLVLAYLPGNQAPTLAANDCIIDNMDSEDCSVMVYEVGESKMKIIWVMEQQSTEAEEKT